MTRLLPVVVAMVTVGAVLVHPVLPGGAWAGRAWAGPAEAEQTAREVEAAVDNIGGDSFKVQRRGSVRVTEEPDGRYLARLPPLTLVDNKGGQVRIEGATVLVKRIDRRQRQIELTLPPHIPFFDAKGVETYRLEPGSQRFGAMWLPAVNNKIDRVDAAYSGLRFFQTGLAKPLVAGDLNIKPAEGGKAQLAFKLAVDPLPPADPGVEAVTASLDGKGLLGPAVGSPYGTAGQLDIKAERMDDVTGHLSRQGKNRDALNAFATATILRSLGKPRTVGGNRRVHDYRLHLGQDGQFLVNDLDISAMSQLFGGRK